MDGHLICFEAIYMYITYDRLPKIPRKMTTRVIYFIEPRAG